MFVAFGERSQISRLAFNVGLECRNLMSQLRRNVVPVLFKSCDGILYRGER